MRRCLKHILDTTEVNNTIKRALLSIRIPAKGERIFFRNIPQALASISSVFSDTTLTRTLAVKDLNNALGILLHFERLLKTMRRNPDEFECVKVVPSRVV